MQNLTLIYLRASLFLLLFIFHNIKFKAQTPNYILYSDSSITDYQTESIIYEDILNKFYESGSTGFYKDLGRSLKLYSDAHFDYPEIALVKMQRLDGKITFLVENEIDSILIRDIYENLNLIRTKWKKKKDFELKFSIAYLPNGVFSPLGGDYQAKLDSNTLVVIQYREPELNGCDEACTYFSPDMMSYLVDYMVIKNEISVALYYSKILCRWFPFNKNYHLRHNELIKTAANNSYR